MPRASAVRRARLGRPKARRRTYSHRMPKVTLASGLTLSYADPGDPSGPAVLMLPGPTDSWRSYQPVLDLLPHGVRAIAVSQRGHGESDWSIDSSERAYG